MAGFQFQPGGTFMPGAPRPPHHPIANLFPMLADDRRESFRASLAERQNHPVVLHRGMLLDGRNRERELAELGKPVAYVIFVGTDRQALDFVLDENLERRHLNESQRSIVAARVASLRLGDNQHSRPAQTCAPSLFTPPPAQAGSADGEAEAAAPAAPDPAVSQTAAAELMSVSRRSVQHAAAVLEKGAPELVEKVEKGELKVSSAADIAALPLEQQKAIIAAADPKAVKEIAKQQRAEKQAKGRDRRLANMARPDTTPLLTGRKYGVLYVDIPREFAQWSKETGAEKSPENHYRVEGFSFLAGMRDKVLACAAENCIIAMWGWASSLPDQLDLMVEWGFASARRFDDNGRLIRGADGQVLPRVGEGRYRSHQIWAKRASTGNYNRGTGFWFIDCHELLLIGARGDVPAPLMGTQAMSILDAEVGDHSEKPAHFRRQLDAYFPGVPKLEMFGRVDDMAAFKAEFPDWDVWGNGVAASQGDAGTATDAAVSSLAIEPAEAAE